MGKSRVTPRKWLDGGYMAQKTKKACCSFIKQQTLFFSGGAEGIV
jgi:hypothetical protein